MISYADIVGSIALVLSLALASWQIRTKRRDDKRKEQTAQVSVSGRATVRKGVSVASNYADITVVNTGLVPTRIEAVELRCWRLPNTDDLREETSTEKGQSSNLVKLIKINDESTDRPASSTEPFILDPSASRVFRLWGWEVMSFSNELHKSEWRFSISVRSGSKVLCLARDSEIRTQLEHAAAITKRDNRVEASGGVLGMPNRDEGVTEL